LERNPEITRIIDFAKVRKLLAARGAEDHNSGWEHETRSAMHGFMIARYIEWFRRDN
jgi:asparagine synthase (glutamine-hydrolysing)